MAAKTAIHSYSRLERRLTLLSWLHDELGYKSTKDLIRGTCKPQRNSTRTRTATTVPPARANQPQPHASGVSPAIACVPDTPICANPGALGA